MRKPRLLLLTLLMVAALPLPGWAGAELFPATEVTARPDVVGWFKFLLRYKTDELAKLDASFAAIEPAEGPSPTATEGHSEGGEAKGAEHGSTGEGDHASPHASGKSEGQKSFSGKVIGAPPALPTVTINGRVVISKAQSLANDVNQTTPDAFKTSAMQEMLGRRYNVTPYAHSPQRGEPKAPITIVQFVDLSCGQCMPELAKIDSMIHDSSNSVLVTHVHAPTAHFQDTNMPAFYGKVAARAGVFWEYRANLIKDKPGDANAIFDELVKSGVSVQDARGLMLNEARRFYRELDADSLLARAFGVTQPPVLFVNGIRVGENGIPLENLPDVLTYVNARIERGLPEPPK